MIYELLEGPLAHAYAYSADAHSDRLVEPFRRWQAAANVGSSLGADPKRCQIVVVTTHFA